MVDVETRIIKQEPVVNGKRTVKAELEAPSPHKAAKPSQVDKRRACTHAVAIPEGWVAPEPPLDEALHGMLDVMWRAQCSTHGKRMQTCMQLRSAV